MIPEWPSYKDQFCQLGKCHWAVPRLVQLAKDLPVFEIPLKHINMYNTYDNLSLRQMVMHFKAVDSADLKYPIILDEDGELMDGRHRIMKALFDGQEKIRAVRFDENPTPCRRDE